MTEEVYFVTGFIQGPFAAREVTCGQIYGTVIHVVYVLFLFFFFGQSSKCILVELKVSFVIINFGRVGMCDKSYSMVSRSVSK